MSESAWSASRARLFLARYAAGLRETAQRIEVGLDRGVQSEATFRLFLEADLDLSDGDIDEAVREAAARRCRRCGCTEEDCSGCVVRAGEPCSWVEEDLCSSCAADHFDEIQVRGERVYFADFAAEGPVLDDVPLIPNHGDVDAVNFEVQQLPTIYLDSELGRYFYVLEEAQARTYQPPTPILSGADVRDPGVAS